MNLRFFIRRILIVCIFILLLINLGTIAFTIARNNLFEDKGTLVISIPSKASAEHIKEQYLQGLNNVTLGSSLIPTGENILDFYYLRQTIDNDRAHEVEKSLKKINKKFHIVSNDGIQSTIQIEQIYKDKLSAVNASNLIQKVTKVHFPVITKYKKGQREAYYLRVDNLSKTKAHEIAEKMSDFQIKWTPNIK